jgi:putative tricarboxylic transport membrane protein
VGALWGLVAVTDIDVRPFDVALGPRLVPLIVAAGLVTLGLSTLGAAMAGRVATHEAAAETAWAPPLMVAAGVAAFAVLAQSFGFVVGAGALFILVARAFGSRSLVRDAVIGLTLAGFIYAVFDRGLGLDLPEGRAWGFLF